MNNNEDIIIKRATIVRNYGVSRSFLNSPEINASIKEKQQK